MGGLDLPPLTSVFPVYFRVLVLITLEFFAWGSNLHLLSLVGINVASLFRNGPEKAASYADVYKFGSLLAGIIAVCLWGFWRTVAADGDLTVVPWISWAMAIGLLLCPFNVCFRRDRKRFLRALKRIFFGGFRQEIFFSDVILADILTSFGKVFGDVFMTVCLLLYVNKDEALAAAKEGTGTNGSSLASDRFYHPVIVPMLVSVPYLCRLRQCLCEYLLSNAANTRHLANAIKYSTALPVIFLSALQKSAIAETANLTNAETSTPEPKLQVLQDSSLNLVGVAQATDVVFYIWMLAALVNSLYSFYWDLFMDWDLGHIPSEIVSASQFPPIPATKYLPHVVDELQNLSLLPTSSSSSPTIPPSPTSSTPYSSRSSKFPLFLRPIRHFSSSSVYYVAIIVDLSLRLTWSLKLSSHLHIVDAEGGVFLMELLEVMRRWLWVYFRLEREWISRGYAMPAKWQTT